jgi:FkbM family methyltransferase
MNTRSANVVIKELIEAGVSINVVYDIGANKGFWYSKWKSILPEATFHLFEANPLVVPNIKISAGDTYNYTLLSNSFVPVDFHIPKEGYSSTGGSYYKELTPYYADDTITINSATLDSVIDEKGLCLPDFIKLDTQGSEVDIIRGGYKCVSNAKIILIEMPVLPYNANAPNFNDYILDLKRVGFIPTGVDDIRISKGVLIQMDLVFVKRDLLDSLHNFSLSLLGV